MARLQGLSPRDARRFRTGRPSLDLIHTGGEGIYEVFELLHQPDDVAKWLGVIADVDGVHATRGDIEAVRALRGAVEGAARAAIDGRQASAADRAVINAAAAQPPMVPVLDDQGRATTSGPVTVDQVLSTLARDAIDLFSGSLASRIRTCAADDCGMFFVDQSRPGTRRWCSMQRCGTLAKVRAHRARNT
jgi:predicted RNA-binding Zn ribbon-like protein